MNCCTTVTTVTMLSRGKLFTIWAGADWPASCHCDEVWTLGWSGHCSCRGSLNWMALLSSVCLALESLREGHSWCDVYGGEGSSRTWVRCPRNFPPTQLLLCVAAASVVQWMWFFSVCQLTIAASQCWIFLALFRAFPKEVASSTPQAAEQSYITSDGRSVSKSWCRAQSGTFDQRYIYIFFESYSLVLFGAPSMTRGQVCHLSVFCQYSL
jgi:hypothetical protein